MKLKVAFVASECTPLAKVGGLGDVIGALPKALASLGVEPVIILSYFQFLEKLKPTKTNYKIKLPDVKAAGEWEVWQTTLPQTEIKVYLLRHPVVSTKTVYAETDDQFRFSLFSLAAANLAKQLKVSLVHCHDWHTALTNVALKGELPTMLTIHNVHPATGLDQISVTQLEELGISTTGFVKTTDDRADSFSLLAQGVNSADFITTVSQTHAEEIKTTEFGGALAELFQKRAKDLVGIVNGIDTDVFNPATDPDIAANYSADNLSGKLACRTDLEKDMGWSHAATPILGIVTRLSSQKGVDIIADILPELAQRQLRLALLGTGDKELEGRLATVAERHPETFKAFLLFDAISAQKIYAGADLFLMPSRFEPCGLGQMIAMRYGTLPVVNKTGGLADTVADNETGFVFSPLTANNLLQAIDRAVAVFEDHQSWQTMQLTAMKQDFSWGPSAAKYLELYQRLTSN